MKFVGKSFIILVISIIASLILKVDFVKDNHFNLITINAVLIGFLFTSFSILLGFLGEEIVQLFEEAGALKKVYSNLINGIICSLSSIAVSILNMTLLEQYIKPSMIINVVYSLELVLLIITFYLLAFVIRDLKIVVDSIRVNRAKGKEKNKADTELDKLLKKAKESNSETE